MPWSGSLAVRRQLGWKSSIGVAGVIVEHDLFCPPGPVTMSLRNVNPSGAQPFDFAREVLDNQMDAELLRGYYRQSQYGEVILPLIHGTEFAETGIPSSAAARRQKSRCVPVKAPRRGPVAP